MSAANNPYSPPNSDPGSGPPVVQGARPRAVDIALVLLAINILLGLVGSLGSWTAMNQGMISGFNFLWIFVHLGLMVWICFALARGRNWARIVLLLLTLLSVVTLIFSLWATRQMMMSGMLFAQDHMRLFMLFFPILLCFVALYLLFVPGRSWFSRGQTV